MDDDLNDTQDDNEREVSSKEELIAADLSHLQAMDGRGSSKPFTVQGAIGTTAYEYC